MKKNKKQAYRKPRIVQQGQLKQFAGSPLGSTTLSNPLNLPGND